MKRYKFLYMLVLSVLALSSCNDFLDREPYTVVPDNEYWQNETQIRIYSVGFYPAYFVGYGTSGLIGGSRYGNGDTFNDDVAWRTQGEFTPIRVPDTDATWDFSYVTRANYMLESIDKVPGLDEAAANHWRGIARFFRALEYGDLTFLFGDVPYFDHMLKSNEYDELYKPRDSRVDVDRKVMEDFKFAMDNVRPDDGAQYVNRYVVAAYASRFLLREGTFLKYHGIDAGVAAEMLALARKAALVVMESGKYSISDDYNALFTSDDLASNKEVIFYRSYVEGELMHCVLTYNNKEAQTGANKALLESYLTADGFPVYYNNATYQPQTADDFFTDRDGRLTETFRTRYFIRGEDCQPFNYSTSGYSMHKFMSDKDSLSTEAKFRNQNNVTDCPVMRYAEVLLNYAEATYELGTLTQADLDKSINLLRARRTTNLPALQIIGGQPAVGGVVYDDPKRDADVSSMLWELRRERRVEMAFEGLRYNDLKRWKKLDYMCNATNPDIRLGAYIRLADYPKANLDEIIIVDNAPQGYILCNTGTERRAPTPRNYVRPVPRDQITLYKNHGYTLSQTKEWEGEE